MSRTWGFKSSVFSLLVVSATLATPVSVSHGNNAHSSKPDLRPVDHSQSVSEYRTRDGVDKMAQRTRTEISTRPTTVSEVFGARESDCRHEGEFGNGYLVNGASLPPYGPGYYYFPGADPKGTDNWACEDWVILHIQNVGVQWERVRGERPRIGIGDISWYKHPRKAGKQGGPFQMHRTHQNGLDIDVRYIRKDKREAPLDLIFSRQHYDQQATQEVINLFIESGASLILVNTRANITGPGVHAVSDHSNHFHVRYPNPSSRRN